MKAAGRRAPRIHPAGDEALVVEFGEEIHPRLHERVLELAHSLERRPVAGVREWVPTYRSLLVYYDPGEVAYSRLAALLQERALGARGQRRAGRLHEIPVFYGGEFGPDLTEVAAACALTPEEVVHLHAAPEYRVYMLGFTPGFCYLGDLPAGLAMPRRPQPRPRVPAGTVGIGGRQTGIYSLPAPGGWRWIGWTPFTLWDPGRRRPFLLQPGDRVRFVPQPPPARPARGSGEGPKGGGRGWAPGGWT